MIDLDKITTEKRNPLTMNIDTKDTLLICRIINNEDKKVPEAVEPVLPQIAAAIDSITERMEIGGRLFYIGAGTSGRLGVLDASECPPTYSVSPELVQGIIAGGEQAMFRAKEGIEDNENAAADDLAAKKNDRKGYSNRIGCQRTYTICHRRLEICTKAWCFHGKYSLL